MNRYLELARPRIVLMVLIVVAVSAYRTAEHVPTLLVVIHAVIGTGLITAGSIAMNEWFEHRTDALMDRTAGRPVPSGRTLPQHALAFGLILSLVGLAYLSVFSSRLVAWLAVSSWLVYVAIYTPLKTVSVWQTPVGAAAGAMPVLIGAAAAEAISQPLTWIVFAFVFFWQFPHAMAIAWLYRNQYAAAGLRLVTVYDPTGWLAAILAAAGASSLILLSLVAAMFAYTSIVFGVAAASFSAGYLAPAIGFFHKRDDQNARTLLWSSLIYLPATLLILLTTA